MKIVLCYATTRALSAVVIFYAIISVAAHARNLRIT